MDYWKAGQLIAGWVVDNRKRKKDQFRGKRRVNYVEALAPRIEGIPCSVSTLRACYRLATYWNRDTARTADQAGIPFYVATQLVTLDAVARRLNARQASKLKYVRQRLGDKYASGHLTVVDLRAAIRKALDEARAGQEPHTRRRCRDTCRACVAGLKQIAKELDAVYPHVPADRQDMLYEYAEEARVLAAKVATLLGQR